MTNTQKCSKDKVSVLDEIDIIAEARKQAKADQKFYGGIKVLAPAKVNLFLGVSEKDASDFHPVDTVLHTLVLHDVLYMRKVSRETPDAQFSLKFHCKMCEGLPDLNIPAEKNLAYKAIMKLYEELEVKPDCDIEVVLEKHIPTQSGLGGGSSDAAAALLGAAHLWGIDKNDKLLEQIASQLGCDVPFFLRGGCAYYEGRGDIFKKELSSGKSSVVLIRPNEGVSTALAYETFDAYNFAIEENSWKQLDNAKDWNDVPLCNNLAYASEKLVEDLASIKLWAEKQSGCSCLLSGSGSVSFVLCPDLNTAQNLAQSAQVKGWWARTTQLSPLGVSVLPL